MIQRHIPRQRYMGRGIRELFQNVIQPTRRVMAGIKNLSIPSPVTSTWKAIQKTAAKITNIGYPIIYVQYLWDWYWGLWDWIKETGYTSPELESELALFMESLESGPHSERNKTILTKILDMNKRYQQLNETPAQSAFNRILKVTTLNVMRNPNISGEQLAKAELALARLWKAYHGSPADHINPDSVESEFSITEPVPLTTRFTQATALPSTVLSSIPFINDPPGKYQPSYEPVVYPRFEEWYRDSHGRKTSAARQSQRSTRAGISKLGRRKRGARRRIRAKY